MGNNHYMYVVLCQDNTFYTGYTNNLKRRISMHNNGTGAKYTRSRGPVSLLHFETFPTKQAAMQAEYWFKRLSRKEKEAYLAKKELANSSQFNRKK